MSNLDARILLIPLPDHIKVLNKLFRLYRINKAKLFTSWTFNNFTVMIKKEQETVVLEIVLVAEGRFLSVKLFSEIDTNRNKIVGYLFCYCRIIVYVLLKRLATRASLAIKKVNDNRFMLT